MKPKHNKIFPNDPFLCLVIGGSGKGKTHFVYDLLTTPGLLDYDNLIIYTNKPRIKYYMFLYHGFKNKFKKERLFNALRVFERCEDEEGFTLEDIKAIIEGLKNDKDNLDPNAPKIKISNRLNYDDIPKNQKTLVVFDDCINDGNQEVQKEIFTSGRGDGIGAFYITQSFTDLESIIKKNASCCAMFDLDDYDLQNIHRRFSPGLEMKPFKSHCKNIWDDSQYKHIFINPNLERKNRIIVDIIKEDKEDKEDKDEFS